LQYPAIMSFPKKQIVAKFFADNQSVLQDAHTHKFHVDKVNKCPWCIWYPAENEEHELAAMHVAIEESEDEIHLQEVLKGILDHLKEKGIPYFI